ncbi:MAG: Zn-ribbon domain-containing OB-fold protein [Spirochaetaceae bacterium]|nr:Zn-ribbon domain-containing OB-fold protein [Myxococcales bacterium]MCB9724265.1 Zn-ribbon domain-containing OB-fold protein [Spirochaetaceae bacterium]
MKVPTGKIPLPRPTALSRPHWDGCREGTLRVQRCRDCQTLVFIPQPCCGNCLSERLEWVDSSGRGTIYSYTTVYRPQQPVFETPYTVVIVELEEGWHMLSNLLGVAPDDVRIGAEVEVDFHAMSDEITLPYFKLRSAS